MNKPFFLFFLLFFGCDSQSQEYPEEIVKYSLENQFDAAKLEVYRMTGGQVCDCRGTTDLMRDNEKGESVLLLESNLKLIDFSNIRDTITYTFKFETTDQTGQPQEIQIIPQGYTDCSGFFQMVFQGKSLAPFKAIVEGGATYDYLSDPSLNSLINKNFLECIGNNKINNPWLKKYIHDQNISF